MVVVEAVAVVIVVEVVVMEVGGMVVVAGKPRCTY